MPPLEASRNMQLIRTLPALAVGATAVAIGNFDGMHLGHQAVLAAMQAAAREEGLAPSVLSFEPHPRRLFAPHAEPFRLEPLRMKLARLREAGVARVYLPRFNRAFSQLSAEDFLSEVLGRTLGAKAVITGAPFTFGHQRSGTNAMLSAWGRANGVRIITVPPLAYDGEICSSSTIRHWIGEGDVARARAMLGHPYRIAGRIVHGEGRGAGIGFATANIALPPQCKWPAHGVYAVRATVATGTFDGVANLGVRPTFGGAPAPNLEVHLFDHTMMLYGQRMDVDFYGHVRPEQKFDSLGALTAQIAQDCTTARTILAEHA